MVLEDADGSASAMAIKVAVCALFVTSLLFCFFGTKGQTSSRFPYTPWIPFVSRLLYMKCNASPRHKRHINTLGYSPDQENSLENLYASYEKSLKTIAEDTHRFCRSMSRTKLMWLIAIDAYSKWPEVVLMKTVAAYRTIQELRLIFV